MPAPFGRTANPRPAGEIPDPYGRTASARPAGEPTVLIPAWGRLAATRRAIASLQRAGAGRLMLIDDEGKGGGDVLGREFPDLEVVRTERPLYWTGCIALGAERCLARGDAAVLFFNQDVTATDGYLESLEACAAAHPGAIVGSTVLYAQDPATVWSAGGRLEWWGRGMPVLFHGQSRDRLPARPFAVDWLFGMGTRVPREVLERVGLPDAARFPMAWGDSDFSLRAREAGVPLLVDPGARLLHEVGGYDARAAGPPSARLYVSWLRDDRHNLSLSAAAEVWRRHGPRVLWPLSLALRVLYLLGNYLRIRVLFPGEGRDA